MSNDNQTGTYVTTNAGGHVINVEAAEVSTRTFHSNDYRRAAGMLQRARAVKGNRYQLKPAQQNFKVDKAATALAAIFLEDAPDSFDAARFLAGTQLPSPAENVLLDSPPEDEEL